MKKLTSLLGILALFSGVVLLCGTSLGADKATEKLEKPAFVDLDGDGFDDNASAENQDLKTDNSKTTANGIATDSDSSSAAAGFIDFGAAMPSRANLFLNNSSAFASAKQRVTSGFASRGGFSSAGDFGGSELGTGVVIGGACVGGVCH